MSQSRSGKPDLVLEGVELLFQQKGGSASFAAKVVLSLNGVDPSCMNSITVSSCRAKVLKYPTHYMANVGCSTLCKELCHAMPFSILLFGQMSLSQWIE
jgi:hypothetical protein